MAEALQRRGGTTAQHSSFTGLEREITIDTDKNTVVVHDGVTAGGHTLAKSSEVSDAAADVAQLQAITGTTTEVRYDKLLASLDVIEFVKTTAGLATVRYEGDDNSTVYYRDVMVRDGNDDLIQINHFYNTSDLVTASGITLMPRTNGEIDTVTYSDV